MNPPKELSSKSTSLPVFHTRFIGRKKEILRLSELVNADQLVTVLGLSGLGKTRLSVEVGRRMRNQWRDGVCFVYLEGIDDFPTAMRRVADALALPLDAKLEINSQLAFALSHREMLLILDAAESVVSQGFSDWINKILTECPGLNVLVTSQKPIELQGEQIFPLRPMGLPENSDSDADSVQLFATRVRQHLPDWQLTEENLSAVAKICRTLDGIPLALELAAAQLKPGGENALLDLMEKALDVLIAMDRDRPERHRSMTVVLDRLYAQLSQPEHRVLQRLSLLDSGTFFDTDVPGLTGIKDGVQIVNHLHGIGLLQTEGSAEAKLASPKSVRYRMLNIVQLYARSRTIDNREETEERIARYYLQKADQQAIHKRPETQEAAVWFRVEALNLHQCCRWALERKDLELLCGYATRLQDADWERDNRQMLRRLWKAIGESLQGEPARLPNAEDCWEALWEAGLKDAARRLLEITLERTRKTGSVDRILKQLLGLSELELWEDAPYRAREYLSQASHLTEGRPYWETQTLRQQGLVAWAEGQPARAEDFLLRALAVCEEHGLLIEAAGTHEELARLKESQGDLLATIRHYDRAIQYRQEAGQTHFLCGYLQAQADAEAHSLLTEALDIFREKGKPEPIARCLLALGDVHRRQGRWAEAEVFYREAETHANREEVRCLILNAQALLHETGGQHDAARMKWQSILPTCKAWKLSLTEDVTAALERLDNRVRESIEFIPTHPPDGFAIYLFGPLEMRYDNQPLSLNSPGPVGRELLAYLAFHHGKWMHDDRIWEALWANNGNRGTFPPNFHSLRTAISRLRRVFRDACPDEQLHRRDGCYCFDPNGEVWSDWREFDAALKAAKSAELRDDFETAFNLWAFADRLYRGELLADYRYAEWCVSASLQTRHRWLAVLERWSRTHYLRGEYEASLTVTNRLLTLVPNEESAHQLAMECLTRLGRQDEALRQYERCVLALHEDGASPSSET